MGFALVNKRFAIPTAAAPDIRITPMAPRPGGVEIATIVSSSETILCKPSCIDHSLRSVFFPDRLLLVVSAAGPQYLLRKNCWPIPTTLLVNQYSIRPLCDDQRTAASIIGMI